VVRVDTYLTSRLNGYFRYANDFSEVNSLGVSQLYSPTAKQWLTYTFLVPNPGHGYAAGITYTISSTMVNEFLFGKSYNTYCIYVKYPDQILRQNPDGTIKMGDPPNWWTKTGLPSDPQGLFWQPYVSEISFGSPPANAVSVVHGANAPYTNWNDIYSFSDNLSKVAGRHSLKAGVYIERTGKVQQSASALYTGSFNFASNRNWPADSGHGYANALLGNFQSYSEGAKTIGDFWFTTVEFYMQDSWRITRRLNLDLGVRFYHLRPQVNLNRNSSAFVASSYDPNEAPRLYYPAIDPATGKKVGLDRATGSLVSPTLIGFYVRDANGNVTGNPANGFETGGMSSKIPPTMFEVPALAPVVRIGFAYDLFGTGRTALRGGFGMFYHRGDGNQIMVMGGNPPWIYVSTLNYSNFAELAQLTQQDKPKGPSNVYSVTGSQPYESAMNGSFGLQQNLGFSTVLDVSYVGSFRRHALLFRNVNPPPMFSRFDPANVDPTSLTKSPLPDYYFRPIRGLGALYSGSFGFTSNYHSLQTTLRRQFTRRLSFGAAYTFSKVLGTTAASAYFPDRTRNYGVTSQDRTHVLAINYVYELPKLGQQLGSKALGAILDDWTLSGVTSYTSGTPFTPSLNWNGTAPEVTGSEEAAVVNVVGDPYLPVAQRAFRTQLQDRNVHGARAVLRDEPDGGMLWECGGEHHAGSRLEQLGCDLCQANTPRARRRPRAAVPRGVLQHLEPRRVQRVRHGGPVQRKRSLRAIRPEFWGLRLDSRAAANLDVAAASVLTWC
jgi:hypothetical protein